MIKFTPVLLNTVKRCNIMKVRIVQIISFTLINILLLIVCSGCSNNTAKIIPESTYKNVFFTQWDSYAGHTLEATNGLIEIPYLDYNHDRNYFPSAIQKVELIQDNPIIKIDSYNFLDGNKSNDFDIKTLSLHVSILEASSTNITGIKVYLKEGSQVIWKIGNWKLDVLTNQTPHPIELGLREIQLNIPDHYKFTLKNTGDKDILIKGLQYDNKHLVFNKMAVASNYNGVNTPTGDISDYTLKPGETKVFNYFTDPLKLGTAKFIYFKPYLKYQISEKDYLYPLDSVVYSASFTPDVASQIKNIGIGVPQ